jgi:hypothetical protein
MLDPDEVGRRLQKHFAEVSDDDFLRRLRRVTTDTEWEEFTRNRARVPRPMLGRLRLGLRKIIASLRPKPAGAGHPKRL